MQTKKQISLDMFLDNMQFNTILIMVLLKTHQSFSFCAKKKHIFIVLYCKGRSEVNQYVSLVCKVYLLLIN